MNLRWERLDNALTEIWQAFTPAIINFAILLFFFYPVWNIILSDSGGGGGFTKNPVFDEFSIVVSRIFANFPKAETTGDIEKLYAVSLGFTVLLIVVFLSVVFILDAIVRAIGRVLPFVFVMSDRDMVSREGLVLGIARILKREPIYYDGKDKKEIDRIQSENLLLWKRARIALDALPEMSGYSASRDKLVSDRKGVEKFLTYFKSYMVIFLLTSAVTLLYPKIDFQYTRVWYIVLILLGLVALFYLRVRYFFVCRDLVQIDVETYVLLGMPVPDSVFQTVLGKSNPDFMDCVTVSYSDGESYGSYVKEIFRSIVAYIVSFPKRVKKLRLKARRLSRPNSSGLPAQADDSAKGGS